MVAQASQARRRGGVGRLDLCNGLQLTTEVGERLTRAGVVGWDRCQDGGRFLAQRGDEIALEQVVDRNIEEQHGHAAQALVRVVHDGGACEAQNRGVVGQVSTLERRVVVTQQGLEVLGRRLLCDVGQTQVVQRCGERAREAGVVCHLLEPWHFVTLACSERGPCRDRFHPQARRRSTMLRCHRAGGKR